MTEALERLRTEEGLEIQICEAYIQAEEDVDKLGDTDTEGCLSCGGYDIMCPYYMPKTPERQEARA